MRAPNLALAAVLLLLVPGSAAVSARVPAKKKPGAQVNLSAAEIFFKEGTRRLRGKETCFITNASGLGRFFLYDAMEETGRHMRDRLEKAEITLKHLFTPEHGLTAQEEDHGNTRTKAGDPETIYLTTVEKLQEKIKKSRIQVQHMDQKLTYTKQRLLREKMRKRKHGKIRTQLIPENLLKK